MYLERDAFGPPREWATATFYSGSYWGATYVREGPDYGQVDQVFPVQADWRDKHKYGYMKPSLVLISWFIED